MDGVDGTKNLTVAVNQVIMLARADIVQHRNNCTVEHEIFKTSNLVCANELQEGVHVFKIEDLIVEPESESLEYEIV